MASKKKSAIQARQGHPTGIIDDTAKAFGKAAKTVAKNTRLAGEFVSDVASDRRARLLYSTLPKQKEKLLSKIPGSQYRAAKKATAARRAANGEKWVKAVKPKPAKKRGVK